MKTPKAKSLVKMLQAAGHDVMTVNDGAIASSPDDQILAFARQNQRVLLTRNCSDFQELHQANSSHPGILAVYQNADPSKNMSYQNIVNSIANLIDANLFLENKFIVLNQWNY